MLLTGEAFIPSFEEDATDCTYYMCRYLYQYKYSLYEYEYN